MNKSQIRKQNFAVTGMSCTACKARIERAVAKVDGVEDVSVQLLQNRMTVDYDEALCSEERIVQAVKAAGYETKAINSGQELNVDDGSNLAQQKKRLNASVILTAILLLISMGPMVGINLLPLATANANTQLGLCLMVMALNSHYFKKGFRSLLHLMPDMDSLVAVGASASFIASLLNLMEIPSGMETSELHDNYYLYFESVATILTMVSVGKYFEGRAKLKAVNTISQLYELAPDQVTVRVRVSHEGNSDSDRGPVSAQTDRAASDAAAACTAGAQPGIYGSGSGWDYEERQVPLEAVRVGDEVVLRSGDKVGVDGVVIEGSGFFDESALTGESMQVKKEPGSSVVSTTFLSHGYIVFRVTKVGSETALSKIIALVDEANSQKAPIARVADQMAFFFVPAVILLALLTAIVWLAIGAPPSHALNFAVSVLVVSCPCALGLATPTAIMVATGRAASRGIIFKTPEALESLHHVDIMVFDKTGTITHGKMNVVGMALTPQSSLNEPNVVALAFALEQRSEHPIGYALVDYCNQRLTVLAEQNKNFNINKPTLDSFTVIPGKGISAHLAGEQYFLGSTTLMQEVLGKEVEPVLCPDIRRRGRDEAAASMMERDRSVGFDRGAGYGSEQEGARQAYDLDRFITVNLFSSSEVIASFYLGDEIKEGVAEGVRQLHKMNVRAVIVSGDSINVVRSVAEAVGVSTYKALCLPQDKVAFVQSLMNNGHIVAMMGDGINDAPSLSTCNVAVSIANSTDIAKSCADVILMQDRPSRFIEALRLAHLTMRNIKENLFWAFFYNIICIPIAAGVLYPFFGFTLTPMLAAVMMSLSSLCVVANALRLRNQPIEFEPERERGHSPQYSDPSHIPAISLSDDSTSSTGVTAAVVVPDEKNASAAASGVITTAPATAAGSPAGAVSTEVASAVLSKDGDLKALEPIPVAEIEPGLKPHKALVSGEEKVIMIEGMSCQHCVKSVTRALEALPGCEVLEVSLDHKCARIRADEKVSDDAIIKAISAEDFTVVDIQVRSASGSGTGSGSDTNPAP